MAGIKCDLVITVVDSVVSFPFIDFYYLIDRLLVETDAAE